MKNLMTSEIRLLVVDLGDKSRDLFAGYVRELFKSRIADKDIQKLLPFQTSVTAGENYFHIVNDSAYVVETNYHLVPEGATLCAKAGEVYGRFRGVIPTCPGCVAKAKTLIVAHLYRGNRD